MGNSCYCQQPELELHHQEIISQISKDRQKSIDNDDIFSDLVQQHSSMYQYQEGIMLTLTKPLSPRSQHQIIFLEPKDVLDEGINYQPTSLQGILSSRSNQQELPQSSRKIETNGKERIKKKVNFLK
ncbi:unnamed protein product [Paramecium sonneborni]|uniref:Uncharacterized protein n=1 Tax=Paramecium sonneborni TaxID=65129 RepID=A0A8S1R615_9CILI|nr:unnamed protein product [Paramecium sonneborni]